jgi:1-phosphofructokinase family hexose kinase
MILTLTINPAIDRIVSVDKLVFEDRAYILDQTEVAGGRGVNASVVLHRFGGKTLALLTSGGAAGERMEKSLAGMGFPFEVVRVRPESRTNLTISDKQGLTVKLNEVGHTLAENELVQIRRLVEARLAKARWLMICGSMQPGVPASFYCDIIEMAKARGVKTLLDTDGDALAHGVEAKPTVITPNQHEAERLLGRALLTRTQFLEAVDRLQAMGPESVILSLGSRGAIGSGADGVFEALPRESTLSVPSARAIRWPPHSSGPWIRRSRSTKRCAGASRRERRRQRCREYRFQRWSRRGQSTSR